MTLTGDNSITCNTGPFCIAVNELKLSCTGSSATLTLTSNSDVPNFCGIYTETYDPDNLSTIAADGFTVNCSIPTENEDGTFTWTYTVTKN